MKMAYHCRMTRIIQWILDRAVDGQRQLGVNKIQLESDDIKKFENMLHDKIQELEIELEDSNSPREREVLANEVDTRKCVLDHLFKLKPGAEGTTISILPICIIIDTISMLSFQFCQYFM